MAKWYIQNMAFPSPENIKNVLNVGGVFGLALVLITPALELVVRQSGKLKGVLASEYKFRLYRLSLIVFLGIVLISAAAWTYTKAWPPKLLETNCDVRETVNTTVGSDSPVVNCNQTGIEIDSSSLHKKD